MKRVFLGIDLPKVLKTKIEKLKTDYHLNRLPIKLVEPENSHLAIKFLDDLSDEQIDKISQLVKECADSFKNFEATIDNSLVFPNFFKPRVLALKVISQNLTGLAKKMFMSFDSLDFVQKEDRPYAPHITLGRIKDKMSKPQIETIKNIKFTDNFFVDSIQLFESKLTSNGPIYTVLKNFKLR